MSDRDDRYDELDERLSRLEDGLERLEERLDDLAESRRPEDRGAEGPEGKPPPERSGQPRRSPEKAPPETDGEVHRSDDTTDRAGAGRDEDRPDPQQRRTYRDPAGAEEADDETDDAFQIDRWIDKIGVGLLLIGLAFFYHLSVERGWITPAVRVGFGLLVGAGLSGAGWRIREDRKRVSQILMGAGSVAFYISLFAAHEFYQLLPYSVTFGAMTLVVVATFILANTIRDPALAVVAAIGGFATPVLLTSDGSIPGLMTYTCVLVAGMTAIYLARGWQTVLGLTALGAWNFVGYATLTVEESPDTLFTVGGLVAVWFCVGVVPTIRTWLWADQTDAPGDLPTILPALLAVGSGLLGYGVLLELTDYADWWQIGGGLGLAVVSAGAAHLLSRRLESYLVSAYRVLVPVFVGAAFLEMVPGDHFIPVLALIVLGTHGAAAYHSDRVLGIVAHLLTLPVLAGFVDWYGGYVDAPRWPFFNTQGMEAALVVAASFVGSRFIGDNLEEPYHELELLVARVGAHVLLLGYVVGEARPFEYGDVLISSCWGIYAVGLVVAGLWRDSKELKMTGLGVVVLTAGKLLLFDLTNLDTVWRVLLFLGFGSALVATSYFAPSLDGSVTGDDTEPAPTPDGDPD